MAAGLYSERVQGSECSKAGDEAIKTGISDTPRESKPEDIKRWFIYKLGRSLNLFDEAQPQISMFVAGGCLEGEQIHFLKSLDWRAARLCKLLEKAPDKEPEAVDMQVIFGVSRSGQEAWAFVLPPLGKGEMPGREALEARISAEGICYGVDADEFLKATAAGEYLRLFVIARGTPAQDGQNGTVTERFLREKQIRLNAVESGSIDYKDLHWLQKVSEGDVICDLVQPAGHVDGRTVKNAKISAKQGKMPAVPAGKNTRINEEKTALLAMSDGQLNFAHGAFHVEKILNIAGDVDISVGNLDVIGDLNIDGSVSEGFSVTATGNIVVRGLVEGAYLKAGGNIQIILGIKGNGRGQVTAQGDVVCKYLENAVVRAGKNVIADNIINSNVYAGAAVTACSGSGVIIGGRVAAGDKISAKRVGNESNRATELLVGEDPNSVETVKKLREEAEAKSREIKETTLNIAYLENAGRTEALSKLRLKLSVDKMSYEKKLKQIEATKLNAESVSSQVAADIMYPQTSVEIYGAKMVLSAPNRMCRIYKADGELQVGMK